MHDEHKYDLVRLTRDDPRAWALLPLVFERIQAFCSEIDTETPPEELIELVVAMFVARDSRLGLWVCVENDVRLVAHLLATVEPLYGDHWRFAIIRQARVDDALDLRKESRVIFDEVVSWARGLGLPKLLILTHRNEQAMARSFGFTTYKSMLVKRLS